MKSKEPALIPSEHIHSAIFEVRSRKVLLDFQLARLYEIENKLLIRSVRRNIDRFPEDFMFQLSDQEVAALRIQIGSSNEGRGGRRYRPYVFTEHGILMLSSVLKGQRAVQVNIEIMRAFVQMREFVLSHSEIAKKLGSLERRYDAQFKVVFNSIRELINAKPKDVVEVRPPKRQIGFGRDKKD